MEERIQELRELEKRATPGPWCSMGALIRNGEARLVADIYGGYSIDEYRANAKFIAAMRNGIAAILDDYDQLLAESAQIQRERDAAVADIRLGVRCDTCKHRDTERCGHAKCQMQGYGYWEWRGPQEVEHG